MTKHLSPITLKLLALRKECERLRKATTAANTLRAYADDWKVFHAWCRKARLRPMPATEDVLSLFVAELLCRGLKVTTAERRVRGVVFEHLRTGLPSPLTPAVRALLAGARRLRTDAPRQMQALSTAQIKHVAKRLDQEGGALAIRNRAVILLGFASALRRANLRALNLEDIEFCRQGLVIHVRREKQDQEGKGRLIGIPFGSSAACPVKALRAWLRHRGVQRGPLFTSSRDFETARLGIHTICLIVKSSLSKAGIPNTNRGPHSLRAGLVTAATEARATSLQISAHTGQSLKTLQKYIRKSELFRANVCSLLRL